MTNQIKLFIAFLGTLAYFLISTLANCQSPQAIPYQAVARDTNGSPLTNQAISIRITLIDSNVNSIDYQETHSVTTNSLGLFTLNMGQGVPTIGALSAVLWPISGNEYVQVEMDANGGTNYTMMGVSKLNSVPFALHANTSGDNKWNGNGTSIYNNNSGAVGIGTSSPSAKLDVNGMAFFRNNTGGFLAPSVGAGIKITTENNQGNIFGYDYSSYTPIDLILQGEGAKVGIGNHYPESALHVTSPNAPTAVTIGGNSQNGSFTALRLETSANSGGYSNIQSIKNSGSDWGDIVLNREGGYVGIGTSTPVAKLDVAGNVKIADGTQGAGKVLTSDADGIASWVTPPVSTGSFVDLSSAQTVSGVKSWNDDAVFNTKIGIRTTSPVGELEIKSPIISEVMDQTQANFSASSTPLWQSFKAGVSGSLTKISLMLASPLGNNTPSPITITIYDGTGTGGTVLSSTTSTIQGPSFSEKTYTFNSPANLIAGNQYTFSISVPTTSYVFIGGALSNPYLDGGTTLADWDIYFKTYVGSTTLTSTLAVVNGQVGVGNNNPSAKLDINGSIKITDGTQANGKVLISDASGFASWQTMSESDPKVGALSATKIPVWNGSSLVDGTMNDVSGKIGIGTAAPNRSLDVSGDIAQGVWTDNIPSRRIGVMDAFTHVAGMEIENTTLGGNYSQKLHLLSHHYAGSYGRRFTIDEDGNVGIGTETPNALLHVNGSAQFGDKLKIGTNVAEGYFQNTQDGAYRALQTGGTQGYWFQNYNGVNTTMYVGLNGTYQNKVGIGTTTPSANLEVTGSTKTTTLQITNGASNGSVLTSDANGNASWVQQAGCVILANGFTASASGTGYASGSAFAPVIISSTGTYGDTRLINSGAMNTTTGNATSTGVFTAPVNGYYQVSIKAASVVSNARLLILASLNGAAPTEIWDVYTGNNCTNCSDMSHTEIIYLQAGDTHRILRSGSSSGVNEMIISYRKL